MNTENKKTASYNINKDVLEAFNELAKKNSLNKGLFVENKMREYLKECGQGVK